MERAHAVARTGTTLGKYADRHALLQALDHALYHRAERMRRAAAVVDRAGARGEPADEWPALDLGLGDEAHHVLAVHQLDIHPRDVVGDEQRRTRQRFADAADAQTEAAQKRAGPPARRTMVEPLAANGQAPRERIEHRERQRHRDQDMQEQQRRTQQIAQRAQPVARRSHRDLGFRIHRLRW